MPCPAITPELPAHVIDANAYIWTNVTAAVREAEKLYNDAHAAHQRSTTFGDENWTAARVGYAKASGEIARAKALTDMIVFNPVMRKSALRLIAATRRYWK